jgi:quaternary ammonium compound-resistance protein SugE
MVERPETVEMVRRVAWTASVGDSLWVAWLRLSDEGAVPDQRKDGQWRLVVYWLVLVVAGVLEAVWATALARSDGLSRFVPTTVFVVGLVVSMAGLAVAMRGIPAGTAYVVWVGIGATLTVAYAMATGNEPISGLKLLFLGLIVGGVIGLKAVT